MKQPTLPERIETLEHEVAGLESTIDARTRRLWDELKKLQTQVQAISGKPEEE